MGTELEFNENGEITKLPDCIGGCGKKGFVQYAGGFACGDCMVKIQKQIQEKQRKQLEELNGNK